MDYHGHGTHVAGIIAADNSWYEFSHCEPNACRTVSVTNIFRLTGVAPDAELLIYKVFSDVRIDQPNFDTPNMLIVCTKQDPWETDEETIMQALCDAYNAGVCFYLRYHLQVVLMLLGGCRHHEHRTTQWVF
jgi:hypothetical protein